jgi:hypothetical protein
VEFAMVMGVSVKHRKGFTPRKKDQVIRNQPSVLPLFRVAKVFSCRSNQFHIALYDYRICYICENSNLK